MACKLVVEYPKASSQNENFLDMVEQVRVGEDYFGGKTLSPFENRCPG
jgi:hypothetical protein